MIDNRLVVERAVQAIQEGDTATAGALMHPDIVVRYPQSGEVIRGRDNYLAMLSTFPSGVPEADLAEPRGGHETVQVSSPLPSDCRLSP